VIKNIIYLDEEKLYSLSSQIFEGMTEYILKETGHSKQESEEQRGPIASGRILADTILLSERSVEKKLLLDHALSLFESRLTDQDLVTSIDSEFAGDKAILAEKSFVRIDAKASFIDASKITALVKSFNEMGEALTHISQFSKIDEIRKLIGSELASTKQQSKQAELRKREKALTDTAELAKQAGLYQDPKFLAHLALVTEYGFSDQLEIQQFISGHLFSACLKRQCLRESVDLTTRKYSRNTEKKLVVLGVVTQSNALPEPPANQVTNENMTMKEAVTNMVNILSTIEGSLSGKAPYEIVIDPIAVYVNL